MTDPTQLRHTSIVDESAQDRILPPRRRVEAIWWLVIVALSLVDANGFNVNLSLMLPEQTSAVIGLLVAGCALIAVAIPTVFGFALTDRHFRPRLRAAVLTMFAAVWLGLGTVMVIGRLTSEDISTPVGPLSSTTTNAGNPYGPMIVAGIFLLIYLTTGALAFTHSYVRGRDRHALNLRAELARLRRQQAREQAKRHLYEELQKHNESLGSRLKEAEQLETEIAQAFSQIEHEEARIAIARNVGEPGATELLLRQTEERSR